MKGLGDTQQTLSILGIVVAATALCALAARFSTSAIEESVSATKLAA